MTPYWAQWRLKTLAWLLFTQQFVQVQIKESIKAPRHSPLWGKSIGERFPVDGVIIIPNILMPWCGYTYSLGGIMLILLILFNLSSVIALLIVW